MCWFKKKQPIQPLPQLVLPYPEEAENVNATMSNVDIKLVFEHWMINYNVPLSNVPFFKTIKLELTELPITAGKVGTTLLFSHKWANTGVMAHEMAHIVYDLLTYIQREEFSSLYKIERETNELVKLVFRTHGYAYTNDIEAHAEIYRYLGDKMPDSLKKYYPKLF
jgi:hypothetical protein